MVTLFQNEIGYSHGQIATSLVPSLFSNVNQILYIVKGTNTYVCIHIHMYGEQNSPEDSHDSNERFADR